MENIDKSPFPSFFVTEINLNFQNIIGTKIEPEECKILPSFTVYCSKLKDDGVFRFKRCLISYMFDMIALGDKRKKLGKKMVDYLKEYLRGLDKGMIEFIKETLNSFEKMRRKIGEAFGTRWISFYKITSTIFENYI